MGGFGDLPQLLGAASGAVEAFTIVWLVGKSVAQVRDDEHRAWGNAADDLRRADLREPDTGDALAPEDYKTDEGKCGQAGVAGEDFGDVVMEVGEAAFED